MQQSISYLNEKKIPFMIREDGSGSKLFAITFTKVGKFIRANGIIISKNMYVHIARFMYVSPVNNDRMNAIKAFNNGVLNPISL